MQKFTTLTGVAAPLPMINVDTDKIIPKQYGPRQRSRAIDSVVSSGPAERQHFDQPVDIRLAELHDLDPDFLRQHLEFGGHDAAEAHAVLVTDGLTKDVRVTPDARLLIERVRTAAASLVGRSA